MRRVTNAFSQSKVNQASKFINTSLILYFSRYTVKHLWVKPTNTMIQQ